MEMKIGPRRQFSDTVHLGPDVSNSIEQLMRAPLGKDARLRLRASYDLYESAFTLRKWLETLVQSYDGFWERGWLPNDRS